MVRYVLYYLLAVSVIGAVVCIYDKLAAPRGWKRVPERTLFFWALVGGGPGVYADHAAHPPQDAAPQLHAGDTGDHGISNCNHYCYL